MTQLYAQDQELYVPLRKVPYLVISQLTQKRIKMADPSSFKAR